MRLVDRQPGVKQSRWARLGILTHDPKQNIRSRLILPFHPRLEQTGVGVATINDNCLAPVMGVV